MEHMVAAGTIALQERKRCRGDSAAGTITLQGGSSSQDNLGGSGLCSSSGLSHFSIKKSCGSNGNIYISLCTGKGSTPSGDLKVNFYSFAVKNTSWPDWLTSNWYHDLPDTWLDWLTSDRHDQWAGLKVPLANLSMWLFWGKPFEVL